MSKKHDNDSFMQLIPRKDTPKDKKKSDGKSKYDTAEYWKAAYEDVLRQANQRIKFLEDELEVANDTIALLEASTRVSDKLIQTLQREIYRLLPEEDRDDLRETAFIDDDLLDDDEFDDRYGSPFESGFGLSICSQPTFYAISDGKKKQAKPKKKKFKGVDLEVQPNRGFRIAPIWEDLP